MKIVVVTVEKILTQVVAKLSQVQNSSNNKNFVKHNFNTECLNYMRQNKSKITKVYNKIYSKEIYLNVSNDWAGSLSSNFYIPVFKLCVMNI